MVPKFLKIYLNFFKPSLRVCTCVRVCVRADVCESKDAMRVQCTCVWRSEGSLQCHSFVQPAF